MLLKTLKGVFLRGAFPPHRKAAHFSAALFTLLSPSVDIGRTLFGAIHTDFLGQKPGNRFVDPALKLSLSVNN